MKAAGIISVLCVASVEGNSLRESISQKLGFTQTIGDLTSQIQTETYTLKEKTCVQHSVGFFKIEEASGLECLEKCRENLQCKFALDENASNRRCFLYDKEPLDEYFISDCHDNGSYQHKVYIPTSYKLLPKTCVQGVSPYFTVPRASGLGCLEACQNDPQCKFADDETASNHRCFLHKQEPTQSIFTPDCHDNGAFQHKIYIPIRVSESSLPDQFKPLGNVKFTHNTLESQGTGMTLEQCGAACTGSCKGITFYQSTGECLAVFAWLRTHSTFGDRTTWIVGSGSNAVKLPLRYYVRGLSPPDSRKAQLNTVWVTSPEQCLQACIDGPWCTHAVFMHRPEHHAQNRCTKYSQAFVSDPNAESYSRVGSKAVELEQYR